MHSKKLFEAIEDIDPNVDSDNDADNNSFAGAEDAPVSGIDPNPDDDIEKLLVVVDVSDDNKDNSDGNATGNE